MNIKLLLTIGIFMIVGLMLFPLVKTETETAYNNGIKESLISSVNVDMAGINTKTGTAVFTTATVINSVTDFGNFSINCAPATSGSVCANYTITGNSVEIKSNSTFQNGTYSVEANIDTGTDATGIALINLVPFAYILLILGAGFTAGYFAIKE